MHKRLPQLVCALAVGYVLAHYFVLAFNHWYFAEQFWLKLGLGTVVCAAAYASLLATSWAPLWRGLGWYWLALHAYYLLQAKSLTLEPLEFVMVLDMEAAMVCGSGIVIAVYAAAALQRVARRKRSEQAGVRRELALRRKLRRARGLAAGATMFALAVAVALAMPTAVQAGIVHTQTALAQDRHAELADPELRIDPQQPELPGVYPTPAAQREKELFFIVVENWEGGAISVCPPFSRETDHAQAQPDEAGAQVAGHVLTAVHAVNPEGYTASGWGENGAVCATSVNGIHIKTDHDYINGRGVIFSLLPVEQGQKDPKNYLSYLSLETSLLTDMPGGTGIFGGEYAPLVGSRLLVPNAEGSAWASVPVGWVPEQGGRFAIAVERYKYNPEYIEFENSYGGIIWIKELGMDPYPIGQVLKPVAGIGRFLGTLYADTGRIRAAHPGVIDISTTPYGVTGGFQIIPRDHAMSPEMFYTRYKTQWMVVGPLWALDPSWEGLPPLFKDYLYPAWNPPDLGNVQYQHYPPEVDSVKYLDSFTVLGRYADAEDPDEYMLLREAEYLDHYALKNLTHLRIYFPRDSNPEIGLDS